jgi:hypothetical protein
MKKLIYIACSLLSMVTLPFNGYAMHGEEKVHAQGLAIQENPITVEIMDSINHSIADHRSRRERLQNLIRSKVDDEFRNDITQTPLASVLYSPLFWCACEEFIRCFSLPEPDIAHCASIRRILETLIAAAGNRPAKSLVHPIELRIKRWRVCGCCCQRKKTVSGGPLCRAAQANCNALVALLIDHGFSPTETDSSHWNPMQYARHHRSDKVVEFLEKLEEDTKALIS